MDLNSEENGYKKKMKKYNRKERVSFHMIYRTISILHISFLEVDSEWREWAIKLDLLFPHNKWVKRPLHLFIILYV